MALFQNLGQRFNYAPQQQQRPTLAASLLDIYRRRMAARQPARQAFGRPAITSPVRKLPISGAYQQPAAATYGSRPTNPAVQQPYTPQQPSMSGAYQQPYTLQQPSMSGAYQQPYTPPPSSALQPSGSMPSYSGVYQQPLTGSSLADMSRKYRLDAGNAMNSAYSAIRR